MSVYVKCLKWGFGTGVVTGAATGAASMAYVSGLGDGIVARAIGLPLLGAVYGAVFGALVALVPTVFGALVVTTMVERRHPDPSSTDGLQRDLVVVFCVVVAILNVGALLLIVGGGDDGLASVIEYIPLLLVANACLVLMLRRARISITREWSQG